MVTTVDAGQEHAGGRDGLRRSQAPAPLGDGARTQVPTRPDGRGSVRRPGTRLDADVAVVGGGPAGAAAAYWLAAAGRDVVVLDKSRFPREKVCGDGLTPRGTRALVELGIDVSEDKG